MSETPPPGTIAIRTLSALAIGGRGSTPPPLNPPVPWLMAGAMTAAFVGVKVMLPDWLRDTIFVLTGLSMGASASARQPGADDATAVTLAALVLEPS